jgi:hypothetical protein
MLHHDAALEAIVDELRNAGYVETYTEVDGKEATRLTPEGEKVARLLAMTHEASQDELIEALLGAVEA